MKVLLLGLVCFVGLGMQGQAEEKILLAVISKDSKATFESKVFPFLREQIKNCSRCEITNVTPYNEAGEFVREQVASAIQKLPSNTSLFFFSWNEPLDEKNQPWIEELRKKIQFGVLVLGPAGEPVGEGPSVALKKTLLGQIPEVLIIGELNERERLPHNSFYGPEMLTAICPPKEWIGQGLAPHFFAGRFAREFSKKTSAEWVTHLKGKKLSTRKIWPNLVDFFGRE